VFERERPPLSLGAICFVAFALPHAAPDKSKAGPHCWLFDVEQKPSASSKRISRTAQRFA